MHLHYDHHHLYHQNLGGHPNGHDDGGQVCRQLYTEHKLLSLTADGQLEVDSFKVGLDQPVEYVHPKISKFEYFKELLVYPYATNAFVLFETRQSNFFFQLPSACACFVREDFMLEFRFSRQKLESYITVTALKAVSNGI